MKYVIGIDGGGTKTHAIIADTNGTSLSEIKTGPSNIAAFPITSAAGSIIEACDGLLNTIEGKKSDIASICLGVAGTSYKNRGEQLAALLNEVFPNTKINILPDYAIALTACLNNSIVKYGTIVIAGTGSIAYGENSEGICHRSGGYGWMVEDSGSGYGVGRAAIAAALYANDKTGPNTTITDRIILHFELTDITDIISKIYSGEINIPVIASLSKIVSDAANIDDDEVACKILMHTGGALARFVESIHNTLFLETMNGYPIYTVGNLWQCGLDLTDAFHRSVKRFAPGASIETHSDSPAYGAVLRAISS